MAKPTDVRVVGATLYLLPIHARMPLKFGPETVTEVTCARVMLTVRDHAGRSATGWGETPLSVQWVWPSDIPYQQRFDHLQSLCKQLTTAWTNHEVWGHPLEIGHGFVESMQQGGEQNLWKHAPWLAALVCNSPFDLALHDAYANLVGAPVYEIYNSQFMNDDLSRYLVSSSGSGAPFESRFPSDYLAKCPPTKLAAWHLVGGKDPLCEADLKGNEPADGYPVLLRDWIRTDGLRCLKIKLTGIDASWDFERVVRIGTIALEEQCVWLSVDFNCTVKETDYVNEILDRLMLDHPRIYQMILYIEQPFPYDLEAHPIDVRSVSARKPLFMDESAHDWKLVRLGRELGWSGVALKTCKTQTEALLELCWAKAHGMPLMVQDLSNPMLAQIPHIQLAAHAGTIMGVETNGMQFYPQASHPEAMVHPGIYHRRNGCVELSSIYGSGFGYRIDDISRTLPAPAKQSGHSDSSG
jgi:L-alanine-DL-glutamate epimerase-like enolase superfamily enzyme